MKVRGRVCRSWSWESLDCGPISDCGDVEGHHVVGVCVCRVTRLRRMGPGPTLTSDGQGYVNHYSNQS